MNFARIDTSKMQQGACVENMENQADENQGRGLDHESGRTLSDVLKDGVMFVLLFVSWLVWGGDE